MPRYDRHHLRKSFANLSDNDKWQRWVETMSLKKRINPTCFTSSWLSASRLFVESAMLKIKTRAAQVLTIITWRSFFKFKPFPSDRGPEDWLLIWGWSGQDPNWQKQKKIVFRQLHSFPSFLPYWEGYLWLIICLTSAVHFRFSARPLSFRCATSSSKFISIFDSNVALLPCRTQLNWVWHGRSVTSESPVEYLPQASSTFSSTSFVESNAYISTLIIIMYEH